VPSEVLARASMAGRFVRARVREGKNEDRLYRHSAGDFGIAGGQARQGALSGAGEKGRSRHHEGAPGSGSLEDRPGKKGTASERRGAAQSGSRFSEALRRAAAQHVRLPAGAAAEKQSVDGGHPQGSGNDRQRGRQGGKIYLDPRALA